MTSGAEISHLIELMPASGRMYCKIVSNAHQSTVIAAKLPRPGQETRPISINFDLWQQLTRAQRDLLLLRTVCWLLEIQWFKPDLYQGLLAAGTLGTAIELLQGNVAGVITLGGLTTFAASQVWRKNRSTEVEMIADQKAVQVAQRRGYALTEAAIALIEAIEAGAKLEGRTHLSLTETLRCQNLKAVAAPAPISGSEIQPRP